MKTLKRLSKKASEFCALSNYDADKVKEAMKSKSFALISLETKKEMKDAEVDVSFPYMVWNPYNLEIK